MDQRLMLELRQYERGHACPSADDAVAGTEAVRGVARRALIRFAGLSLVDRLSVSSLPEQGSVAPAGVDARAPPLLLLDSMLAAEEMAEDAATAGPAAGEDGGPAVARTPRLPFQVTAEIGPDGSLRLSCSLSVLRLSPLMQLRRALLLLQDLRFLDGGDASATVGGAPAVQAPPPPPPPSPPPPPFEAIAIPMAPPLNTACVAKMTSSKQKCQKKRSGDGASRHHVPAAVVSATAVGLAVGFALGVLFSRRRPGIPGSAPPSIRAMVASGICRWRRGFG